ncbi:hypothetical protein JTE90_022596 [Oedothorax gibbosus]|uniref:Uncharacterized protein n=1 Tax=Oedothorax gibbosus TaxID=931172 RepID=A0AAV6TFB3_9ARAC|nr:hypothetical protein JTE90_022596 [Oedothorax gibbosus]
MFDLRSDEITPEFRHITKRRKRNRTGIPLVTASETGRSPAPNPPLGKGWGNVAFSSARAGDGLCSKSALTGSVDQSGCEAHSCSVLSDAISLDRVLGSATLLGW